MKLFDKFEAVKFRQENLIFITHDGYLYYIYNVDIRNAASIHLAEKFNYKKGETETTTTESGKVLHTQTYYITG